MVVDGTDWSRWEFPSVTHPSASNVDDAAITQEVVVSSSADASTVSGFESFYHEHHARLERALILSLGSVERGQDAAAEAFARALARWDQVGAYANPSGWIFRVGVNWARSRRRRARREVAPAEFARIIAVEAAGSDETDDSLMVTNALAGLSFEHRVVVVARFYLDWSEAELAAALDVPAGTVKSRTSRALSQLAQILEDER